MAGEFKEGAGGEGLGLCCGGRGGGMREWMDGGMGGGRYGGMGGGKEEDAWVAARFAAMIVCVYTHTVLYTTEFI